MLEQVCAHIHNYFISAAYPARYSIESGVISPAPALKEGQRFWLCGSDLNDGVYTYHESGITNDDDDAIADLQDEEFSGTVSGMAVPKTFMNLVTEIGDWMDKYGEATNSPFTQETVVGVYSYMKATTSTGTGTGVRDWTDVFASRLNEWRKVCL